MKRVSALEQAPRWLTRRHQAEILHQVKKEKNPWKRVRSGHRAADAPSRASDLGGGPLGWRGHRLAETDCHHLGRERREDPAGGDESGFGPCDGGLEGAAGRGGPSSLC